MVTNLVDLELRQLRRAAKSPNPTGVAKFSRSQVAAALALEQRPKARGSWLHRVEVDAAEAQKLAGDANYSSCMQVELSPKLGVFI